MRDKERKKQILNETRILTDAYDGIQKARKETANRISMMERDMQITEKQARSLHFRTDERLIDIEGSIKKEMKVLCQQIPVFTEFLECVVGIGETYTTKLLAGIGDIERFPKISMLWKYCGLAPVEYCDNCNKRHFGDMKDAQSWIDRNIEKQYKMVTERSKKSKKEKEKAREDITAKMRNSICACNNPQPVMRAEKRVRGIATIEYNPRLKSLLWNIGKQFVKQGDYYRAKYDEIKSVEKAKNGGILSDGHIDSRARRKVVKLFVSHLWMKWRELEGLPVTKPYSEKYLGHQSEPVPIPIKGRI